MKGLQFKLVSFFSNESIYTETEVHGGLTKAHSKTLNLYAIMKPCCLHGVMIQAYI